MVRVFSLFLVLPGVLSSHILRMPRTLNKVAPSPWLSKGCFTDKVTDRALSGIAFKDTKTMTISACTCFCRARDFPYAGVEYGTECYCGAAPKASAIAASMSDCRMPCAGNRSQSCGSGNRLQVYFNPQKDQPASTAGRVGDWMHTGCYTDSVAARALPIRATDDGGMSAAKCTAACQAKGFPVAGTEYSTECWCGHALKPASRAPNGDCNLRCSGDFAQICGGPDRLTVFQNMPASNTMACYETSTSNDFVIEAIYRNGEPPVSLSVVKTSVDTAVLTSCANCSTPYLSQYLHQGQFHALEASDPGQDTVSPALAAGQTLTLTHASHVETFAGYCTMTTKDATLLAANGRHDMWALCPNGAAGRRQDVVWAPQFNHPHYSLEECEYVDLALFYCEEDEEEEDDIVQ